MVIWVGGAGSSTEMAMIALSVVTAMPLPFPKRLESGAFGQLGQGGCHTR